MKTHTSGGDVDQINPLSEIQILYAFSHLWFLDFKSYTKSYTYVHFVKIDRKPSKETKY